jgi:methyl-accepting chemotaxis protein
MNKLSLRSRLGLFFICALAGLLILFAHSMYVHFESLLHGRYMKTQHVTEVAYSILEHFHALEKSGALSRTDAQKAALETAKTLRYDEAEYFWINDLHPTMLMHPMKPELDGKDISDLKDPNGKRLFIAMAEVAQKDGAGFVAYQWPKPGKDQPQDKISYVKHFQPWGWIVGSGIYLDDVYADFSRELAQNAAIIVLVALVLWFVSRKIRINILGELGGEPSYAAEAVARIAAGDLSEHLAIATGDNSSLLARMKQMQDQLKTTIAAIAEGTRILNRNAEAMAISAREISLAAANQSEAVSDTSASVEEMTVSIGEISKLAHSSEENASRAMSLANDGETLMQRSAAGTREVVSQIGTSSANIETLRERSIEIGSIANVIKEIADQTNLLALNAAIEAARAGEQGRGFAVVADEVRKLAERTTQATSEISTMIGAIQNETGQAVTAMETVVPLVNNGTQIAGEAVEALHAIHGGAEENLGLVRDVASATREQATASDRIAKNIESIAQMVEETSASLHNMADNAAELKQVADRLNASVGYFRV